MTRVAALDCGTNSVRLLIADVPAAGSARPLIDVVRRMEIVRLGEGVDRIGRLSAAAIERTRTVLAEYGAQIREHDIDPHDVDKHDVDKHGIDPHGAARIRMVATSATRDATNADEFRAMVRATLGIEPEVLTGDEEARLSFLGAVRGLPSDAEPPYLVFDIGGGSTEFVVGGLAETATSSGASTVDRAISVDIGCVRMTERHLPGDPPTPEQIEAAEADIIAAVDRALAAVDGYRARTLIGLAGSVTTVAALALGLDEYDPARSHHARIPYQDVAKITAGLLAASRAQRLSTAVMHPGRADVIGAGALVLRIVMERTGADSVIASEHDILDGVALSLG